MKQIYGLIVVSLLLISCGRGQKPVANAQTTVKFYMTDHDFGTYAERESKTCSFVFRNEGSNPLVISRAEADCGCTTVAFPKRPIAPGKKDSLIITYDGNGFTPGAYRKWITVQTNGADTAIMLTIRGRYEPID